MAFMGQTARERSAWSRAISEQIKAERTDRNVSVSDMWQRSEISLNTLYRIEDGQRVPDVSQLARICDALGMSPVTLMQHAQERLSARRLTTE